MATNKDFVVKNGLQVGANTSIEGSITTVDSVQFDANAAITVGVGQLAWNADAGTLDLGISSDVTLQVGQETHVHVKAAEAITNGDVVYASGAVGNSGQIEVSKFIADGTIEERRVIGIATESAALGEFFYVTSFGAIRGISTDGSALTTPENWNLGDILYASPTVAGELTKTLPVAPNPAIAIAFITSEHASNGTLFVRAYDPGFHLGELHDVHISSVANNQVLTYDAVNSRWSNSDDLNLPGDLTVAGNFTVSGNTTLVNTNNLAIEDLNIVLANGANTAAEADGAGITIDGANATLTYDSGTDGFNFNKSIGIGVNPSRDIHIEASAPAIRMQDLDTGDFADVVYNAGTYAIDIDPTSVDANPRFRVDINNAEVFRVDQNSLATLTSINTTTANTTTLNATTVNATTLNGAFGNTAVTIASSYPVTPSTGNIWFDNLNLKLKIFDGTNWQDAVPSGGGSSANTQTTDANATFAKYTYVLSSATSTVSGVDVANNTLSYDTSGIENIEVFVNGVKQVEGASYDYTATTGTSVGFTTTLSAGDVVDVQVYELLTNDAFVLKAGGAFEGTVEFTNTSISQTFTNASLAHGMTLIADTDEFLRINREAAGGNGGVRFSALTDGSTAFNLSAYSTTPSTDGNNAVIRLRAAKSNGSTSETALAADEDVFTVGNTGTELITLKGNGRLGISASPELISGNKARLQVLGFGDSQYAGISVVNTQGNGSFKGAMAITGPRATNTDEQFGVIGNWATDTSKNIYIGGGGWGMPGATNIRFYTDTYSNSETNDNNVRMEIEESGDVIIHDGNVGIGTSNPTNSANYKTLDIRGATGGQIIAGATSSQDFFMYTDGGGANIGSIGDVEIKAGTSGGMSNPNLHLDNDGKVGINQVNPSARLDVYNDEDTPDFYLTNDGNDCAFVMFSYRDVSNHNTIQGLAARGTASSPATLAENDYMLRILGRGFNTGDNSYNPSTEIAFLVDGEPSTSGDPSDMPGRIEFKTAQNGTDSENIRMVIKHNGNVGIGETDPDVRLHVTRTDGRSVAKFETTDDGATQGPYVNLYRNSSSPADGDDLGGVQFTGNYGSTETEFARVGSELTSASSRQADVTFLTRNGADLTLKARITHDGHFTPETSTQDLGSTTNPWQNIYTQDLVLSNESRATGNDIDGTKGNWTVQEGEDHLYLINNKNGKKYRFALEEIE